jgi:hypothetical protein
MKRNIFIVAVVILWGKKRIISTGGLEDYKFSFICSSTCLAEHVEERQQQRHNPRNRPKTKT